MITLKGALSGFRQFLETESPFKMMRIAFNFTLKELRNRILRIILVFLCGRPVEMKKILRGDGGGGGGGDWTFVKKCWPTLLGD